MPKEEHVSDELWESIVRRLKSDERTDYADATEVQAMNEAIKLFVPKLDRVLEEKTTEEDKKMARYKMIVGAVVKLVTSGALLYLGSLIG